MLKPTPARHPHALLRVDGRAYVKGTVDISPAALLRLAEIGVVPPKNTRQNGGEYNSFFLPDGEDGEEFLHIGGDPANAGRLSLKSERQS